MMKISRTVIATAVSLALAPAVFAQADKQGGTGAHSGTMQNPIGTPASAQSGMQDAETVRKVQKQLNDRGMQAGPVDGILGPKTRAALQEFQRSQGLQGGGNLNQQTLAALGVQQQGASSGSGATMGSTTGSQSGSGSTMGSSSGSQSGSGSTMGSTSGTQPDSGSTMGSTSGTQSGSGSTTGSSAGAGSTTGDTSGSQAGSGSTTGSAAGSTGAASGSASSERDPTKPGG